VCAALTQASARRARGASVHGKIDVVEQDGVIRGWCAAIRPPFGQRRVSVVLGNTPVLSGLNCDMFRDDLLVAGIGDGRHGFSAHVPYRFIVAGRVDLVTLIDDDTGTPLGGVTQVRWCTPLTEALPLQCHIDEVHANGRVTGWCWDPGEPDRAVGLDVLANGIQAGTTLAGLFREDLRAAGKGSGHCAFSFFIPWNLVATAARIDVSLLDSRTGLPAGDVVTLRRPQLDSAERRIDCLERQLKLLQGELLAADTRAAAARDCDDVSALFREVASFFQDLADGKQRGAMAGLKARLDETAARLAPVALAVPASPLVTILVLPDGGLDRLHACCAALHRAGADLSARIVVLDAGAADGEDVILIHAAVHNLQTRRIGPNETINDALAGLDTRYVALLPAHLTVAFGWLDRLVAGLETDPGAALLAGAVSFGGETPGPRLLAADSINGLRAAGLTDADAVDALGVVLRLQAMLSLGGLDLSFESLAAQVLDLCLRLRAAGLRIAADETALSTARDPAISLLDQASVEDLRRLRATCSALAAARDASAAQTHASTTAAAATVKRRHPPAAPKRRPPHRNEMSV
jgi:hypothetical protein